MNVTERANSKKNDEKTAFKFRNSKKFNDEKKNWIKKIFDFFRIIVIRSDKVAVFCDVIDAALTSFTAKGLFLLKTCSEFFFDWDEIVFDFLKFNEFDRIVNCFVKI